MPLVHIVVIAVLLGVLLMVFLYQGSSEESESEPAARSRIAEPRETQSLTLSPDSRAQEVSAPQATASAREAPRVTPERAQPELSKPEPSSAQPAEPLPEENPEQASTQTEPPVEPAPTPEPAAPDLPDIPEDEQILLSWRASEYTLQLLGASSRASVDRYIKEQSNREKLLSFETRRQGEPWFVVVTGRYSSAEVARDAIAGLPAGQREAGPWPRPLSEVQEEIETVRGL